MADPSTGSTPECVWDLKAELGEGPNWVARDHALWFTDIKKREIHRFDPATGDRRSWPAPGFAGFVLPASRGRYVAGLQTGLHHFDPDTGGYATFAEIEPELPANRLNDATVAPSGHLWFGTMDNDEKAPTGRLYRLGGEGTALAMGPGCCITNGPAFSPDGCTLYFVDTLDRTVHAFDVAADGALAGGRVFCTIEEGAGHPDGPSIDSAGNVWIGLYGGWAARRYAPDGQLLEVVRFPVANITKIAIGGDDLRTAFATTARQGLSAADLAGQPLAGGLFSFRVEVPGLPAPEIAHGL